MGIQQTRGLLLAAGIVFGGMGLSKVQAKKSNLALRVSLAIPSLCNGSDGTPALPRFLPMRYEAERFPVVIENISDKPVQIWADGNSVGDETLSFEITGLDGKTTVVHPVLQDYSKNILRTVRLLPGEAYVREVRYNATPSKWEGFPDPTTGKPYHATLRSVLTQAPVAASKNPELWAGKVVSAPEEVDFER